MIDGATLNKLIAGRQIDSAQLMIQWTALEKEKEKNVARVLEPLLRADYPQSQGEVFKPPSGLVFVGQERTVQVLPGTFNVQLRLKQDFRTNADRAFEYLVRKWGPLDQAVRGFAPAKFMAFLLGLEFSTFGLSVDVREFLANYIRPTGIGEPADAEWRIAFSDAERYFINLSASMYQKLKTTLVMTQGGVVNTTNEVVDEGIAVRVDVNTKYPGFHGLPDPDITEQDFSELRKLARRCVDETVPRLLSATAR